MPADDRSAKDAMTFRMQPPVPASIIRLPAAEAYRPAGVEYVARATPMGRWGTEEEIAAWFVALCSPISSYVTGAIIPVDGGNAAGEGLSFRGGAFPG